MANRYNREGIFVPHPSRAFRDEEGESFFVEIEIVDTYRFPSGSQAPYNVTVSASQRPCTLSKSQRLISLKTLN